MDKFIQKSAALRIGDGFQNYLGYLRQKGLAEKTVNEHKRFLFGALSHAVAFTDKKVSDLKLTDVASVIESGKRHGEYGSQRAVVTLRQYLKYLKESGTQLPFDWRDIEVPKVPEKEADFLLVPELRKLLKAIPLSNICGLRTRALLETLYSTGMRISEALSVTRDQVPWQARELKIKGKGGDEGIVYFTKRSLYWLKRYLKARKDNCPALFANESGKGVIKNATARNYLRAHRNEWGIGKRIHHHLFRRTMGTHLIEKGADLKSIQHLLRHKSERTTLRYYIGVNKRRAKKIHQRLLQI
jgi:site-specific recombinase XerD